MTSTNQPNDFLSFSPGTNFDKYEPKKMPTTERAVNEIRNFQSTSIFDKSPTKPMRDLAAMINNEVPTAIFMGKRANKTKAGIIKNPPPAPTIPVRIPTTPPSRAIIR